MIACIRNNLDIIKLLIQNCANVEAKDENGLDCYSYIYDPETKLEISKFIDEKRLKVKKPKVFKNSNQIYHKNNSDVN